MDADRFRDTQCATSLRPYEVLAGADRWSPTTQRIADETLTRGWKDRRWPRIPLKPPIDWAGVAAENRTWAFHLHSWDFAGPVLATFEHTRDSRYLDWAVAVAADWADQHRSVDPDDGFAWYDMAIGFRSYRLAYLVDAAARIGHIDDDALAQLLRCVELHLDALANEDLFAAHSNHGFYFAAGQLALARRLAGFPGTDGHERQARGRIHKLMHAQFGRDGVHREHSPDYHRMVHDTFDGLLQAELLDRAEFMPLSERIQEALAWFVLPNGRLVTFGDTPHRLMLSDNYEHISSEELRFVVSGGRAGKPPAELWRGYPDAGYFIVRDGWPSGPDNFHDWSYLAQTCAFHSRVHKHADDLSMVWYDRGHEILVDAGRFGYLDRTHPDSELGRAGFYYSHPSRVFIESTRAHNTVEIDGRSHQRRGVKPYGSALERFGETGGVFYSGSHVRQQKSIRHVRVLAFRPREWLLVYDWLWDNAQEPHTYTQRFHFAPELSAALIDDRIEVRLPNEPELLHVVPLVSVETLEPVRGQQEPQLLGWISRVDNELEPCWSTGFQVVGESTCSMATLLAFGKEPPLPRSSTTSAYGQDVRLSWQGGSLVWTTAFSRPDREDFGFEMSVALAHSD